MPAPESSGKIPLASPLVMVRPEIVIVLPEPLWNTRLAALPFTDSWSAPGPVMATLLSTTSSPLVSVIVAG